MSKELGNLTLNTTVLYKLKTELQKKLKSVNDMAGSDTQFKNSSQLLEKKNKLDTNPNSCIIVTFSANCLHNQRDIHTRLLVLHGLIKEIFFDQLRT